jgi:protoporphyrinogen IX oxidase
MYLWLKALHIIAVMSWMAGLLYLPRLFVYHADAKLGTELSETFKVMEHRLLKFIMMPAMVLTWVIGVVLVLLGHWVTAPWFQAKFVLVLAMTILDGYLRLWAADFHFNRNRRTQKFYRIVNEIPTVLMIAIIALVVVKPF